MPHLLHRHRETSQRMTARTVHVTMNLKLHDEMCEVCWKTGIVTLTTQVLGRTGVTERVKTYCRLCAMDAS